MEITAIAQQTVIAGSNILFTAVPIGGCASIVYREGSGLVTLRGLTNQCRARFRVTFNGNIGLPSNADIDPVQYSISINGEALPATTMVSTPETADTVQNVSSSVFIDVPKGCCLQLSVMNSGTVSAIAENANLIVERVA